MTEILAQLDNLFENGQLPEDESGCLCTVTQLMHELEPSLIMLTDSLGEITSVYGIDVNSNTEAIRNTATLIAEGLVGKQSCFIDVGTGVHKQHIGFGIRLTSETQGAVLSGLIRNSNAATTDLENLFPTLIACGSLVWLGIHATNEAKLQTRRIKHLLAEQDTLKRSHACTVATVITEREERIRQQRDYVVHLEKEVQTRSLALQKSAEKANEASEAKSSFLANMSHEIRTPMTAILGYADLLFESGNIKEAPPFRVEAIETIRRNGRYLVELINDILDIAKVEAGKLVIEKVSCSPSEMIAEVATLMSVRAKDGQLDLNVEFDGPIPSLIQTDPIRLRQILVNLIGNAIKFTEIGGVKILARCKCSPHDKKSTMEFDIIDTGIGLSGPQIAKLFQPFSQVDPSATRRYGGTGLGLALSRNLARGLGGDISVTSLPGKGSTFRLRITTGPLENVEMLDAPETAKIGQPTYSVVTKDEPTINNCRILLAEDGPDNQRLIVHILKTAGAEVITVENGKLAVVAAMTALNEKHESNPDRPFDVILMDMQMPVMDGYEATELLREKGYSGPIIALTANAMSDDRKKCIDAGCDDYATKPIDRKALIKLIVGYVNGGQQKSDSRITNQSPLLGCSILLADDNPTNRALAVGILKKAGADISALENGKLAINAALAAYEDGAPFDIILMDVQMPIMDGDEATKQLRIKGYEGTIISFSADCGNTGRQQYIDIGYDDTASKPIDKAALLETICKHWKPSPLA